MQTGIKFCTLLGALFLGVQPGMGQPIFREGAIFRPEVAEKAMVVAAESHAAEAALAVLREGGNAVDAAVTAGFALAVTLPRAGNIGGGGFMVLHMAESGQSLALDYRETAPGASSRDMFLDENGNADPDLSRNSSLAAGVPGTVAGLLAAHARYGSQPLDELMAPAIELAREGFVVSKALARSLRKAFASGRLDATARAAFSGSDGEALKAGEQLIQTDLAAALELIAKEGRDGFYKGPTAEAIVRSLQERGGIMTLEDLAGYEPVWRTPVRGTYRGYGIVSMPPPSSGGIHLVQMLQLAENFPLGRYGHNSGQGTHILAEIMKHAYADRSEYMGDPDFSDLPVQELLSEEYEAQTLGRINSMTATPSIDIKPGYLPRLESPETTHFSIVDKDGNAVSNTYTLNFSYGCGIMAKGTGILLNNEMDDFSAKPGVPNAYGLIGGEKNAVEAGKRMLSSMTPTLVLKDNEVRIVTGSPGGSRIITTVLQVLLNVIEYDMNAAEAVNAPRFHHQWLPDRLFVERGFPSDARQNLRALGYTLEMDGTIGGAQTIVIEGNQLTGAADPRREGSVAVGF